MSSGLKSSITFDWGPSPTYGPASTALLTPASLPFSQLERRKISVSVEFWISSDRLQSHRNDLDNLVKPVLDGMKRMGIIEDDADIFHLETTKHPTNSEEEVHISVKEWN